MKEKLNNHMAKYGRHCKSYTELLMFINIPYKVVFLNHFVMDPVKMDPLFTSLWEKMHCMQSFTSNFRGIGTILETRLKMPCKGRYQYFHAS